jgi:peroxiredoxin
MSKKVLLTVFASIIAVVIALTGYNMNQSIQEELAITIPQALAMPELEKDDGIIGSSRPDFSLADVTGEVRNIAEWDGKVLAINFWATWCPPCIKEIPEFVELQHKYEAQGLQFIGIALQRPEEVLDFMNENGMNYPVLAGEMEVIEISELYGNDIGALPYTVIIDRAGLIQYVKRGPLSMESAESIISKLL